MTYFASFGKLQSDLFSVKNATKHNGGFKMLILSRKLGEKIIIGVNGDIIVTVLRVDYRGVHLGIEAPKEVTIHRQEVYPYKKDGIPSLDEGDEGN